MRYLGVASAQTPTGVPLGDYDATNPQLVAMNRKLLQESLKAKENMRDVMKNAVRERNLELRDAQTTCDEARTAFEQHADNLKDKQEHIKQLKQKLQDLR